MSFRSDIFYIAANWWWITAIVYLWGCGELNHHIGVVRSLLNIINTVTGNESEATCAAVITLIIVFGSFSAIRNAVKTTILYMVLLRLLSFQNMLTSCMEDWSVCIRNLYVHMIDVQQQAMHMYYDSVLQLPTVPKELVIAILSIACLWMCFVTEPPARTDGFFQDPKITRKNLKQLRELSQQSAARRWYSSSRASLSFSI